MNLEPLCHIDDFEDKPCREFNSDAADNKLAIFLVKQENNIYAYRNQCPHTGINLNWQPDQFLTYDNHFIQCSTHGALFRIKDGYCVRGPCKGDFLQPVTLINKDGQLFLPMD